MVALLAVALPLIAGQLAQFGTAVIDNALAGHLGARVLGAVAVGGSLWILAIMPVIGVMLSLQPVVSELDGAGRRAEAAPLLRQAIMLGLSLGTICGALLYGLGPPALTWVGVAPGLRPGATLFLHAVACGVPAIGLFMAARGLSEGLSRTMPTLAVEVGGLVLLAPLGWVLMYGRLGCPPLGPLGSGIAAATAGWVQALAYLAYLRFSGSYRGVDWRLGSWRPDLALIAPLLRIGLPIAASLLMEAGMFSVAGLLVGRLGEVEVASNQVALNIVTVSFMVPLGVALGVTVRIGNAVGRRDEAGVRRAARAGYALVAVTQSASVTLLLLASRQLVSVYASDPAIVSAASALLAYGALFQVSDGVQALANGVLRGLKDTRAPMLIIFGSYWVIGVPAGAFLALRRGLGAPGMWLGLVCGLTVAAVVLSWRVWRRLRRPFGRQERAPPCEREG